jgi:hypothetical protein
MGSISSFLSPYPQSRSLQIKYWCVKRGGEITILSWQYYSGRKDYEKAELEEPTTTYLRFMSLKHAHWANI